MTLVTDEWPIRPPMTRMNRPFASREQGRVAGGLFLMQSTGTFGIISTNYPNGCGIEVFRQLYPAAWMRYTSA